MNLTTKAQEQFDRAKAAGLWVEAETSQDGIEIISFSTCRPAQAIHANQFDGGAYVSCLLMEMDWHSAFDKCHECHHLFVAEDLRAYCSGEEILLLCEECVG